MRNIRRQKFRLGLISGIITFAGGWAVSALLTPATVFPSYPRWQSTLWVYLGAHFVELSGVYTSGSDFGTAQIIGPLGLPSFIFVVPVVAVSIGSIYICREMSTKNFKKNFSNAMGAGAGYFVAGLSAMVVSSIQPAVTSILLIAGAVLLAIWLGSSIVGAATRGLPFFGFAQLGTVLALGVLVLLGGVAILSVVWGLVAVSFGTAALSGIVIGAERELKRKGMYQQSDVPRIAGLKAYTVSYWKELAALSLVLIGLYYGVFI